MRTVCCSLFAVLLATACDSSSKPKGPSPEEEKKAQEEADEAKRIEERRKQREAEAKAKEDAEKERKAKIAELCTVPEGADKPKKIDEACQAAADAQIEFLKRAYADEPGKLEGVEKNAPMQKANLMKMCDSIDVAVGLKNAFDNAPPEYGEALNDIMATCIQQLGAGPPAGGGGVPKKPG